MLLNLTAQHYPALTELLDAAALPVGDISEVNWHCLVGEVVDKELVAAGGLEICADALLLRSLVTAKHYRGNGIANNLIEALLASAAEKGYSAIWLLTTDAVDYFARKHRFVMVNREEVIDDIRDSNQFQKLCPDSAIVMRRTLT